MRWIDLELSKVVEIEKQVEEVIRTFETLSHQLSAPKKGVNATQVQQAVKVLKAAVASRIMSLEQFYKENDLDSRASRFETCRLKLKKCLKEAGVSQQELVSLAALPGAPTPRNASAFAGSPLRSAAVNSSGGVPVNTPRAEGGSGGKVTLKVYMTTAEFEELRARREAIRTVRKGQGSQAWENAKLTPRVDPAAQGMYTYHEIPFDDNLRSRRSPRDDGPQMRFGTGPSPLPEAGVVNAGTRYQSTNPEVFARTARFPDAAAEWRGGARAVDSARPFNPNVSRTNASNSISKIQPVGTTTPRR